MDDFIIKTFSNGQKSRYFKAICSKCQIDRGYVRKHRVIGLCRSCSILERIQPFTFETRKRMSEARLGVIPWNKNKKEIRLEVLKKYSQTKMGRVSWNKGLPTELKTRIKLSCTNRGIEIDDFDGFSSDQKKKDREKFLAMGLHTACFERSNYTCDICEIKGVELCSHHLNSWKFFPEQRFDLNNLITLCNSCHTKFHKVVGHGKLAPNTKEQYLLFKANQEMTPKKPLYILSGAPSSGKSWVVSNLTNFNCIDSDVTPKKDLVDRCNAASKPLLTLTIGVSTFIKRNPDFDIKLIIIVERIDILNQRMLSREGKITSTIERRAKRMNALAKQAIFSGTSQEVLEFLKTM